MCLSVYFDMAEPTELMVIGMTFLSGKLVMLSEPLDLKPASGLVMDFEGLHGLRLSISFEDESCQVVGSPSRRTL